MPLRLLHLFLLLLLTGLADSPAWARVRPHQYDWADRLTNFNSGAVSLVYDAEGNRVKKVANGVTTLYLVAAVNPTGYPQVVEELTVSGGVTNLARVYDYGLGLWCQRSPGGTTRFYGTDGHGSVRFLTDGAGAVTDTHAYDAYGNLLSTTGSTVNPYRYTGQQWDSDLGMYYLRARYYKPDLGRFWTMDTYEGNKEEPLSLHKYLYCQVNPVNMTDPSGLKSYLYLIGQDTSGLPFRKSAQYLSSQLSLSPGDKVVIQNISGFEEFNKALKENTDIAELNYIGHGGPGILFIGTERDADTNITEKGGKHFIRGIEFDSKSVKDLYVGNVRWDATIHLYSCFSGMSGWSYSGIDRSFSDHFGVSAYGGLFGTKFKPNGKPYTALGYTGVLVFPSARYYSNLSSGFAFGF